MLCPEHPAFFTGSGGCSRPPLSPASDGVFGNGSKEGKKEEGLTGREPKVFAAEGKAEERKKNQGDLGYGLKANAFWEGGEPLPLPLCGGLRRVKASWPSWSAELKCAQGRTAKMNLVAVWVREGKRRKREVPWESRRGKEGK